MVRLKDNSLRLVNAFRPVRLILTYTGQLPLYITEKDDGTYLYHFKKWSLRTFGFAATSFIYSITFLLITYGLICELIDVRLGCQPSRKIWAYPTATYEPFPERREEIWEVVIVRNHLALIMVSYTILLIVFSGSIFVIKRGQDYVYFFNFWNRVVQVLRADTTTGLHGRVRAEIITIGIQIIIESMLFYLVTSFRAVAGLFACFILRPFVADVAGKDWFLAAQIAAFCFMVYGHIAMRAIVSQIAFFCRLLKNLCRIWNVRLQETLDTYKHADKEDLKTNRQEFRYLLKDHLVIVQLFKMTETTFGVILKTFYTSMMVSILFELYHGWKTFKPLIVTSVETTSGNRPGIRDIPSHVVEFSHLVTATEGIVNVLLIMFTMLNTRRLSEVNHSAYHEAIKGFEIVRKRGFLNCESKTERNFIYNMIISFSRSTPMVISADGYFTVNKTIIASMLASLANYFVLSLQFDYEKFMVAESDYRVGAITISHN